MLNVKFLMASIFVAVLGACTSAPPPRGEHDVQALLDARLDTPDSGLRLKAQNIETLLGDSLSRETAISIALLNNPELRIAYAELGIAAADLYQAGRLSNPSLSLAAMDSNAAGGVAQLTAGITQRVSELLLRKPRVELAEIEQARIKLTVAARLFDLSQRVSTAYYRCVAAQQLNELKRLNADAVALGASLAERYYEAGNINRLELSVAEAAVAEAAIDAESAAQSLRAERLQLNRLLGLSPDVRYTFDSALHEPLEPAPKLSTLQTLARQHRLELQAAAKHVAISDQQLALVERWRYLGQIDAGFEYERQNDGSRLLGPRFEFEIPLFDQGQGRILRATAEAEASLARLDELALAIDNAVALAHANLQAARAKTEIYKTRFIPARRDVVARTQELQNYQIVSPFESLRVKAAEFDAYAEYIESLRDYWLARVELARSIGTALPLETNTDREPLNIDDLVKPANALEHSHHESSTENRGTQP